MRKNEHGRAVWTTDGELSGDQWWYQSWWFVLGLLGVVGQLLLQVALASDINIRYHVLRVLFIDGMKKDADICVL